MYANKTNFYVAIGDFEKVEEKKTANHSQEALKTLLGKYHEIDELILDEPYIYCRHRNGLRDIFALRKKLNLQKKPPFVIWISGPTGCGKSREAHEIAENYARFKG